MFCMFCHVCFKNRYPVSDCSCQQSDFHLDLVTFIKRAGMHQILHAAPPALDLTYFIWHFFGLHKYTQLAWLLFLASSSNLHHPLLWLQANFSSGHQGDCWNFILLCCTAVTPGVQDIYSSSCWDAAGKASSIPQKLCVHQRSYRCLNKFYSHSFHPAVTQTKPTNKSM